MATNSAEEKIPDDVRDQIFKELKAINKNNICIDCEKKNTKWASIHLGIQLCIDCAGKHRQYGAMCSLVKSTNLDSWNKKQILFMQKGGNSRALDYFRKCGAISDTQKNIDYKSPIIQKYKAILTAQVESQLTGVPIQTKESEKKKVETTVDDSEQIQRPSQIPQGEKVEKQQKGKKKGKKKGGKKINLEDFETMEFDDGVPIEEKQKIIRAYESNRKLSEENPVIESYTESSTHEHDGNAVQEIPEKSREMTQEETKQKLEEIKAKTNVKNISSDDFKDSNLNETEVKKNLNKFQGSSSISSSAFFGDEDKNQEDGSMTKIKDYMTDKGGALYNKLSGLASNYWKKG